MLRLFTAEPHHRRDLQHHKTDSTAISLEHCSVRAGAESTFESMSFNPRPNIASGEHYRRTGLQVAFLIERTILLAVASLVR